MLVLLSGAMECSVLLVVVARAVRSTTLGVRTATSVVVDRLGLAAEELVADWISTGTGAVHSVLAGWIHRILGRAVLGHAAAVTVSAAEAVLAALASAVRGLVARLAVGEVGDAGAAVAVATGLTERVVLRVNAAARCA